MITYKLQEEKLILGNISIFGFFGILKDANKSERLKLECYFELLQKYKYPIDRIEFDSKDIIVYKDFAKTMPYIFIGFIKSKKQILQKAQKLSAHFAVYMSSGNKKVINLKGLGKFETDIPDYYQAY
jgi:hypothetical protein